MKHNFSKSNTATGKTAMIKGRTLVGKHETDFIAHKRESHTIGETLERLSDACIDLTKEGKAPYAYTNIKMDGVRYGLSLSLHHFGGEVYGAAMFYCPDNTPDEDFMESAARYVNSYIAKRGVKYAKSFVSKVKRNGVSIESVKNSTEYSYYNTVA